MGTAVELYRRPEVVPHGEPQEDKSGQPVWHETRIGYSALDITFFSRMVTALAAQRVNEASIYSYPGAFVEEPGSGNVIAENPLEPVARYDNSGVQPLLEQPPLESVRDAGEMALSVLNRIRQITSGQIARSA